jgi:hypothetical protein
VREKDVVRNKMHFLSVNAISFVAVEQEKKGEKEKERERGRVR